MEQAAADPDAKLVKIFASLPEQLVREVARGRDQRAALEILIPISKLSPQLISQAQAMTNGKYADMLMVLIAMLGKSESSPAVAHSEVSLLNERRSPSSCGYCHSSKPSSLSYGMLCEKLTVSDYQGMVDRGWRRSGTYFYRPWNDATCCPLYTIRLDSRKFQASKAQKNVLSRWHRYLNGENFDQSTHSAATPPQPATKHQSKSASPALLAAQQATFAVLSEAIRSCEVSLEARAFVDEFVAAAASGQHVSVKHESCTDQCKIVLASTVAMQWASKAVPITDLPSNAAEAERAAVKSQRRETVTSLTSQLAHAICQAASIAIAASASPFTISVECAAERFINFTLTAPLAAFPAESVMEVCEPAVSQEQPSRAATTSSATPRKFEFSTRPAVFTKEAFDLYVKYQTRVHKDKPSELKPDGYTRFLCDSPLLSDDSALGSFHQHYRVDGKLIAVGVVDILPKCLSSVYLFYDPDLDFISPGVLTALLEIQHTQHLSKTHPDLMYYYMGFYCHSCPKMRYKGAYEPSDLLCCSRMTWHPLSACVPLLEAKKYCEFSDHVPPVDAAPLPAKLNVELQGASLLQKAAVRSNGRVVAFSQLAPRMQKALSGTGSIYAALVGPSLVQSLQISLE